MKLLLLSRYGRKGSSSRLRHYQFLPWLSAAGLSVDVAPFLPDAYLEALYDGGRWPLPKVAACYWRRIACLLEARRYDLLWLEKEALPWLPYPLERWLLGRRIPYALDLDDAWFHLYDQNRSPLVRLLLGRKLDRLMRNAALVTAGNGYLAAHARAAGVPRAAIVPTAVDLARYPAAVPAPPAPPAPATVGWIGSPMTERYLDLVAGPLAALQREGQVRLALVGASPRALPGLPLDRLPWSEDSEAQAVAGFDIGVMPLANTPWEQGKCGYKLLQYMACGKAVVGSPVGMNRDIIEDGVNGFLAETPAEWERALRTLAGDPALRARLGAAGRAKVERLYAVDRVAPQLIPLLTAAAGVTAPDHPAAGGPSSPARRSR